jgi:hypothetical protein
MHVLPSRQGFGRGARDTSFVGRDEALSSRIVRRRNFLSTRNKKRLCPHRSCCSVVPQATWHTTNSCGADFRWQDHLPTRCAWLLHDLWRQGAPFFWPVINSDKKAQHISTSKAYLSVSLFPSLACYQTCLSRLIRFRRLHPVITVP